MPGQTLLKTGKNFERKKQINIPGKVKAIFQAGGESQLVGQ